MLDDTNNDATNNSIMREYKEETWGKKVDGEDIIDGYKFRGKQPFLKAREGLEKLMVRGAKFEIGNQIFTVLDTRDKGIEREVDIQMNGNGKDDRGIAVIKLYGPNKRKENVVTVSKSKQSDVRFVTLMANKAISYQSATDLSTHAQNSFLRSNN